MQQHLHERRGRIQTVEELGDGEYKLWKSVVMGTDTRKQYLMPFLSYNRKAAAYVKERNAGT